MNSNNTLLPLSIVIDARESATGIGTILIQKYGMNVVSKWLPVGDFIVNDKVVIERKTTRDFAQSIIDGRLFQQAVRMSRGFLACVFLIEGRNSSDPSLNIHPHAVKGAMLSLIMSWRIPVFFTEDEKDTANVLYMMSRQNIGAAGAVSLRPGRRPKRFYARQLYLLQGLPRIGVNLAIRLLEHFGNVQEVMIAPVEELIKVRGLGKKRAQSIRDTLTEKDG